MSELAEKIRETLQELKGELAALDVEDVEARHLLENAVDEIDTALNKDDHDSLNHDSLLDRLKDSAQGFEESHPSLTRAVGSVADALSQLGI